MLFLNFWALLVVTLAILVSLTICKKSSNKTLYAIGLAQQIVFAVTLGYLIVGLTDFSQSKLGMQLHFVITANLYISIVAIAFKVHKRLNEVN